MTIYTRICITAAAALLATSCATSPAPKDYLAQNRDDYWDELSKLCGQTLHGKMVSAEAVDADMAGRPMRMTVASCSDAEIRIPFHVGPLEEGGKWDTSRTWVLRKTAKGIQLKHDHRHEDGTPDAVTNYGGEWSNVSPKPILVCSAEYSLKIDFPVDAESIANFRANSLNKSVTNVWSIGIVPTACPTDPYKRHAKFTYELNRTGEHPRHFKVAFY
jgi:hypothetical protein